MRKSRPTKDDITRLIEHLNRKAGRNYDPRNEYNRGYIADAMSDGATFEECKGIIDEKSKEWGGTDIAKYLRPSTLFGEKFPDYLQKYRERKNKKIKYSTFTAEEAEAKELPPPLLPFPPPLEELKMELNGLASPKMAVMFSLPKIFSAPDVIALAIGAIAFFILSE